MDSLIAFAFIVVAAYMATGKTFKIEIHHKHENVTKPIELDPETQKKLDDDAKQTTAALDAITQTLQDIMGVNEHE